MDKKRITLYGVPILLVLVFLVYANQSLDNYQKRILNLCAIYVVLGLSMNLINGFTGLFSLGHAGFMAVGAYVVGLLTMSPADKVRNFFLAPIHPFLANLHMPFLPALLIAGLIAALFGFLIGFPVLRLNDDYLAIASLGFAEIIRIFIINMQSITNGSLGLKSIPMDANLVVTGVVAILTTLFLVALISSSYGKALKAIREDEIAARSMGINLFKHKLLSFSIGSFFAGIGGGLLASSLATIDPNLFKFTMTFNILLIVVLGGMSSIKGTVVSAIIVTVAMEFLRFLDESFSIGDYVIQGIPGTRMVVFSIILMIVVILKKDKAFKLPKFLGGGRVAEN